MYLRTTKVKRPDGHIDEYIRLVEAHWNNGSPRHRVVCNLGRKDLLAPHIDALAHLIKGETTPHVEPVDMSAVGAWDWGVLLVARHFWEQLGLQAILDSAQKGGVHVALSDRALALVANRLCEPTSEHGIARWLETDYVCDRSGDGGCRSGVTRRSDWRAAAARACKDRSCGNGTGRWTDSSRRRSRSRRSCFCDGSLFALNVTWFSTT
jgi:hypothetical protein